MKAILLSSELKADAAEVWRHASVMPGVNYELMPLVRMTYPHNAGSLDGSQFSLGETAFTSTLMLGGVLPFDLHYLRLVSVEPGRGFHEHSSSLMHTEWMHKRTIEPLPGGGCRVTDEVDFAPRAGFLKPLLRPVIAAVFRSRHRRLRQHFG
jgi:ligand-binding SRPBCC domain-containing protein